MTEYLSTEYAVGWVKMTPPLGSSPPPGDVHSEGGQLRTGVHETVGGGHSDDFRHMEWLGPSLVGRAVNLSISGGNHGGELPVTGEVRNGRALYNTHFPSERSILNPRCVSGLTGIDASIK